MGLQLTGKVALVTGAGSGIGRASATALAREGARVVVSDIDRAAGAETAESVRVQGGEAMFVYADVSKAEDVRALVASGVAAYGRIDCAYNNAGVAGVLAETHLYPEDVWDHLTGVNLKGIWLCMKYEIEHMLRNGGGAVVNAGSVAGLLAGGTAAYNAAMHGVMGLTKQAAYEYGTRGIRVNAVCSSVVKTPMTETVFERDPAIEARWREKQLNGRFAEPEEIAEAVVYLCSDASPFIAGTGLTVDGGWTAK